MRPPVQDVGIAAVPQLEQQRAHQTYAMAAGLGDLATALASVGDEVTVHVCQHLGDEIEEVLLAFTGEASGSTTSGTGGIAAINVFGLAPAGIQLRFQLIEARAKGDTGELVIVERRLGKDDLVENTPVVLPVPRVSGRRYGGVLKARLKLLSGDGSKLESGMVTVRFRRKERE